MQLNHENLYSGLFLNMPAILNEGYPFTVIISMRGGGKTYGALQELVKRGERFMYFRRNVRSLKMCTNKYYHIFRELNMNNGWSIEPDYNAELDLGTFYDAEKDELVGYAASLSTFAGIRSLGSAKALGIKWLVFDEFIPQHDEVRRYDIFDAWSNADETLARNSGDDWPVRRLLMANADSIRGDIVAGYAIGDAYMLMQEAGVEVLEYSPDMLLLRPGCEELARKKADTPLYRVTSGTNFAEVALANTFLIEDRKAIGKRALGEYNPVCSIRGIHIYKHKSRPEYYVSAIPAGKLKQYGRGETDLKRYIRENTPVWRAYLKNRVFYESLQVQTLFRRLYDED